MSSIRLCPRALLPLGIVLLLVPGCASRPAPEPAADAPASASDAVVSADEIQRTSAESVAKALMGRVPGVWVSQAPNGELSVRIRGTTTFGNTEPLYVIDGTPVQAGPLGKLHGISVYDIATIEVLKDVASTSMYGLRGANGVIVIKTKQAGG